MSVQVMENWALIRASIVSVNPHRELADYVTATVKVLEVTPIADYPNLFSWALEKEITVNIIRSKAEELSLSAGNEITARIRKAGPTSAFADPDSLTRIS